jgi:hypothetical protein
LQELNGQRGECTVWAADVLLIVRVLQHPDSHVPSRGTAIECKQVTTCCRDTKWQAKRAQTASLCCLPNLLEGVRGERGNKRLKYEFSLISAVDNYNT